MGSFRHLTGTVGRWSAGHPWTVVAAWAGAVLVLLVTGHLSGTAQLPNSEQSAGQSYQAQQMISRNFAEHASWLPLFMFVVLFGQSMDYHVFILSRIRESYDRRGDTDYAVAHGIKTTAGVVTAAAIVMVFVFLTFATLSMVQLKEMGVGLAVAVLLDATVVRRCCCPPR